MKIMWILPPWRGMIAAAASLFTLLAFPPAQAQPMIREIALTQEDIVAVRYAAGWFVAIDAKGGVYFSQSQLGWAPRFGTNPPAIDVVAKYVERKPMFVLVPAAGVPSAAARPRTWFSTGGIKWEEVTGEAAQGLHLMGDRFVSWRDDLTGMSVSTDLLTWERHEGFPPEARQWSGELGDGYLLRGRYYRWREGRVMSTTDLKQWRHEFTPGSADEQLVGLNSNGLVLVALTTTAGGKGPVHVYRQRRDAPWQRLAPLPTWTTVDAVGRGGGWLIATSTQGQLHLSSDGLRWLPLSIPEGYSPRFAASATELAFGGPKGSTAFIKISSHWREQAGSGEIAFSTGENWASHYTAIGNADEVLENFQKLGRYLTQEAALKTLMQAVAMADTGSPGTKLQIAAFVARGSLGIPKDEARAAQLVQSAADAGYGPAQLDYAQLLLTGGLGLAPDPARGAALTQQVLDFAGTADAPAETKYRAGLALAQGTHGLARDMPRAVQLITAAADADLVPALLDAGRAWLGGMPGVTANPERGRALLQRATEYGNAPAAALLGEAYERGVGLPANAEEAAKWYAKAVQLGMKQAEAALQRVQGGKTSATPAAPPPPVK